MQDLSSFIAKLSEEPGVYRMLDAEGSVLYVGKAAQLKKRVASYFSKQNLGPKTRSLVDQIVSIEVTITRTETEALLLECNLIKTLRPKYNILLRDDKSYPYIHVSSQHPYPAMEIIRSKKKPKQGNYFGPYPGVSAVKETLQVIQKVFRIRNCSNSFFSARSRPCLQYEIKRCTAPCVDLISPEDYRQSVKDAIRFLEGKSQQLLDALAKRMDEAVAKLAYEEAAVLRDQIKALRLVQEQQGMVQLRGDADAIAINAKPGFACIQCVSIREGEILSSQAFFPSIPGQITDEMDLWQETFEAFIAFYYLDNPERIPRLILTSHPLKDKILFEQALANQSNKTCQIRIHPRGVKARWMDFAENNLALSVAEHQRSALTIAQRYQALQALINVNAIERMECFDISHTQGKATVASCVVFDAQGPAFGQYRRFNIENITPGDDYAAMEQALSRRFKRLLAAESLPDLLIIDGGKGQVAVALRVLENLGVKAVKTIGIAKGPGRKAGLERLILADEQQEIALPEDSKALHLLQHIRDEAHRFAITSHRKKRSKAAFESSLESIEGIGAKRRQALLYRFGGIRELAKAPLEEIAKVAGISQAMALKIYEHFHD